MTTAELQRLLNYAAPIFVTPRVRHANNAGWVNERDRLIPRKYNVPPTNWWYRKDIPSRDVFPVLMRNN